KELFHAGVERGSARLVAVTGPAGIGKTRLRWEFDKYADGLATDHLWHSGRCLSFGDGVAYWALAEMVRQRFGIPQDAGLDDDAMRQLLEGVAEGLPATARSAIVARAEGIPLYAIETLRALADRGGLTQSAGGTWVVTGDVEDVDVPASLSSLLAARLDVLT